MANTNGSQYDKETANAFARELAKARQQQMMLSTLAAAQNASPATMLGFGIGRLIGKMSDKYWADKANDTYKKEGQSVPVETNDIQNVLLSDGFSVEKTNPEKSISVKADIDPGSVSMGPVLSSYGGRYMPVYDEQKTIGINSDGQSSFEKLRQQAHLRF